MKVAFSLDDLPQWPLSYPPEGYSTRGIVESLVAALERNSLSGIYAFSNSWALQKHPEYADIMEFWVAAGHHVANHTHDHKEYNDTPIDEYLRDIDRGHRHLQRWISKAPAQYFRHPLCYWGDTESKRLAAKSHLSELGYLTVEVTSWVYEWRWNRAYMNCLTKNDGAVKEYLEQSFLDYSVAQLRYDVQSANAWFGHDVPAIMVGHTLPFFADISDRWFTRLKNEGVEFIPLSNATSDPAYEAIATIPSGKFLVYQQKLAAEAGQTVPMIVSEHQATIARVTEMAKGRTD